MAKIRYIKDFDIVNGFWGTSVSVWFQGCEKHCDKCFNPETWNPNDKIVKNKNNEDIAKEIIEKIEKYFSKNLSFLGGDPLESYNLEDLYEIITIVKNEKPNIKIAIWTGEIFEELIKSSKSLKILEYIDVLVDGRYIDELKCDYSISKNFYDKKRGSSNQRVIDVQKSLESNQITLWENDNEVY